MSAFDASSLRLLYIVDASRSTDTPRLDAVLEGGATGLWLRDPALDGAALYRLGMLLRERTRVWGRMLLIADRADVALAVQADGVQLGRRAPPPQSVRGFYRGRLGVSCHDATELAAARAAGADHVVLAPVFAVPGKGEPLGLAALAMLTADAGLPLVALGGVEPANCASVFAAGVAGVAAIRALAEAPDPGAAARAMAQGDRIVNGSG